VFSPFREPTTRTDNSLKKEAPLTGSLQRGIESPLFLVATLISILNNLYIAGVL
jgi:hypothetical protein